MVRKASNHVLLRDDTFELLNEIRKEEQNFTVYAVTNDIIIREALQMYAERRNVNKNNFN